MHTFQPEIMTLKMVSMNQTLVKNRKKSSDEAEKSCQETNIEDKSM
jgi:hypothetical protein